MNISIIENRPVTSWFSAACAAPIAHKNPFCKNSRLNKSSVPKAKFSLVSNRVSKGAYHVAEICYS